ncbi:hypothetical protein EYF80_051039 [Liparis tanakae]|uniref:Uncharacterized protein n=1 Tax=Liparis tanakae TaxID=230148 RepID=A0A4Z2FC98_9TELE|nr:hypothetical protein EYF80_051039 [Liparis tanakae]
MVVKMLRTRLTGPSPCGRVKRPSVMGAGVLYLLLLSTCLGQDPEVSHFTRAQQPEGRSPAPVKVSLSETLNPEWLPGRLAAAHRSDCFGWVKRRGHI